MALEHSVSSIFTDLTSVDEVSDECKQTIRSLLAEVCQKDSAKMDAYLPTIFHEEFGIVESIIRSWGKLGRTPQIKQLFAILSAVAKNSPSKLERYSRQLQKLFRARDEIAVMALDIALLVLQEAPWVIQDVTDVYQLCLKKLPSFSNNFNALPNIQFFDVLELLVVNYPMQLSSRYFDLWQAIIHQMHLVLRSLFFLHFHYKHGLL